MSFDNLLKPSFDNLLSVRKQLEEADTEIDRLSGIRESIKNKIFSLAIRKISYIKIFLRT